MKRARPRWLWKYPEPDAPEGKEPKLTVLPTPLRRRTTLDVCLELAAVPPTRAEALESLVATFLPMQQAGVRERWQARTLGGTPVQDAEPTELTLEAVGLAGWALDRHHQGLHNHGAWHWMEAARAALAALEQPQLAA